MAQRERDREKEGIKNKKKLGSRGEHLVFIASRVSGRGFSVVSTPNPFFQFSSEALLYIHPGLDGDVLSSVT